MSLTIVLGPTGTGKTERAVELARALHAPVLSLSRYEVFYELPIGCCRPTQEDLGGTQRVYLEERNLSQGELLPDEAAAMASSHLAELLQSYSRVILESGSTSVVPLLWQQGWASRHAIDLDVVHIDDPDAYRRRLKKRMERLVAPTDDRASMIDELASVADNPGVRQFVETIMGYDIIARWCKNRNLDHQQARTALADPATREPLINELANVAEEYGQRQDALFSQMERKMPLLTSM